MWPRLKEDPESNELLIKFQPLCVSRFVALKKKEKKKRNKQTRALCTDNDFIESAAVCIFNRPFVEMTFYNVVKFLYSSVVNKISSTLMCVLSSAFLLPLIGCFTEI